MNKETKKNSTMLAALFALRMFGLFIILPVFTLAAQNLPDGRDLFWVGFALGAFGLSQVFFQIPYGIFSDIYGRKPLIFIGLIFFGAGSLLGALSDSVFMLTIARILQGAGAFSGVISALAADITVDQELTKTMAMIGSSIALMFALSLILSPILFGFVGLNGIFACVFLLTIPAFWILHKLPENPQLSTVNRRKFSKEDLKKIFLNTDLNALNTGIFLLSSIQTAFFILLPRRLLFENLPTHQHYLAYTPAILLAVVVMVPFIISAEKKNKMAFVFRLNIAFIALTAIGLYFFPHHFWNLVFWIFLFFVAFNVLEATLPSLLARRCPPEVKGTAMGVYNTAQSAGMFFGGMMGGALGKFYGEASILVMCLFFALLWLFFTKKQNFAPKKS